LVTGLFCSTSFEFWFCTDGDTLTKIQTMTFQEQLIITVVDKAIIGLIIIVAVFLFNKKLEQFKSRQVLTQEIAKQRIVKITQIWESIYKWETEVVDYTRFALFQIKANNDNTLALEPNLPTLISLVDTRAKEVRKVIESNRFWLDRKLYELFGHYHGLIHSHLGLLLERPLEVDIQRFEEDLHEFNQNFNDYLGGID
jgi:hypothetical protein